MLEVISWDDYFMSVAFLSAMRCCCSSSFGSGACIVNENRIIVGTGYSGLPRSIDTPLPGGEGEQQQLLLCICHAIMNAILNRTQHDLKRCAIYCTNVPCCDCMKYIIQSGIRTIYIPTTPTTPIKNEAAVLKMINAANIKLIHLNNQNTFQLNFK